MHNTRERSLRGGLRPIRPLRLLRDPLSHGESARRGDGKRLNRRARPHAHGLDGLELPATRFGLLPRNRSRHAIERRSVPYLHSRSKPTGQNPTRGRRPFHATLHGKIGSAFKRPPGGRVDPTGRVAPSGHLGVHPERPCRAPPGRLSRSRHPATPSRRV
jgi:hypothetical protein